MSIWNQIRCDLRDFDRRSALIVAIIVLLCGIFSAAFTTLCGGRCSMYYILIRPPFSPPRTFFPIIWTILYLLIGGAAGAIRGSRCCHDSHKYRALLVFAVMMIFNIIWLPLFFAANAFFLALIDILIMMVLTAWLVALFWRCSVTAGLIMAVYLLWLLFSFFLNFGIILFNR